MVFQVDDLPEQLKTFRNELDDLMLAFNRLKNRGNSRANINNFDRVLNFYRLAKSVASMRRERNKFFTADLFGEPAWDILLDLFIASADERPISVTSACLASGVPLTTALRCLDNLVRQGLVVRSPDMQDRRRAIVSLTPKGHGAVEAWIDMANDKMGAIYA